MLKTSSGQEQIKVSAVFPTRLGSAGAPRQGGARSRPRVGTRGGAELQPPGLAAPLLLASHARLFTQVGAVVYKKHLCYKMVAQVSVVLSTDTRPKRPVQGKHASVRYAVTRGHKAPTGSSSCFPLVLFQPGRAG